MGGWQSHQRGHSLSKSVRPGSKVRIVCADTSRARQTADQIYRGFHRLMAESPDTPRIIAATHSGPIRAFATWAHGYDPGEPYSTEFVVVRIRGGGRTALVAYRNRVTEVNVPPPDEIPVWH